MPVKSKYGWVNSLDEYYQLRDAEKTHRKLLINYQNAQAMMTINDCVITNKAWTYVQPTLMNNVMKNSQYKDIKPLIKKIKDHVDGSSGTAIGVIFQDDLLASSYMLRNQFDPLIELKIQEANEKNNQNEVSE